MSLALSLLVLKNPLKQGHIVAFPPDFEISVFAGHG